MSDEKLMEPIETKPVTADSKTDPEKKTKDDPIHSGPPGNPKS